MTGSKEKPQAVTWILRVMAALLAMYGLYLFGRKDIFSYMFLKQQFGFLLPVIYRRGSQVFPHQKTLCRKMKRRKEDHDEKNPCIRCFDSCYALYVVRMWENNHSFLFPRWRTVWSEPDSNLKAGSGCSDGRCCVCCLEKWSSRSWRHV